VLCPPSSTTWIRSRPLPLLPPRITSLQPLLLASMLLRVSPLRVESLCAGNSLHTLPWLSLIGLSPALLLLLLSNTVFYFLCQTSNTTHSHARVLSYSSILLLFLLLCLLLTPPNSRNTRGVARAVVLPVCWCGCLFSTRATYCLGFLVVVD
jgi:hypothetical protein